MRKQIDGSRERFLASMRIVVFSVWEEPLSHSPVQKRVPFYHFSPLSQLPVQTVAVCGYLEPLSAVVLAAWLLSEKMTAVQIVGAVCILGGALVGELARPKGKKVVADSSAK